MKLKENERIILAGEMPLRAPNGEPLPAVPVYKIVPAADADAGAAATVAPGERFVLAGVSESKLTAEERYKAIVAGVTPPQARATHLYIKEPAPALNAATELTAGERWALNPLVADLITEFSAAMRERETLKAVQ